MLLEEGVYYDQCIRLAKLLAFVLLHSILQGQICLLLQVFLDFLLSHMQLGNVVPDMKDQMLFSDAK